MNKEKEEKLQNEAVKAKDDARRLTEDELEKVTGGVTRHRDDITTPEI